MENVTFAWRPCRSCKNGRVALFTSVVACDACSGTGVDLSDARLEIELATLAMGRKTRVILHRFGVDTVRQLLLVVACGKFVDCDINAIAGDAPISVLFISDIRSLLLRSGLRLREDGVVEDVRHLPAPDIFCPLPPVEAQK